MCRMLVYKGSSASQAILLNELLVKPIHSIVAQSYASRERLTENTGLPSQINADGFGVGWYTAGSNLPTAPPAKQVSDTCDISPFLGALEPDGSAIEALHLPPSRSMWNEANVSRSTVPNNHNGSSVSSSRVTECKVFRKSSKDYKPNIIVEEDVAARDDSTPGVFVSISPAWNNENLIRLAKKIKSPLVFAHVRAASIGSVTAESNCHPFACGRLLWMHNGNVADFLRVKRLMIKSLSDTAFSQLHGSTDSEHCFAVFLTHLEAIVTQGIGALQLTPGPPSKSAPNYVDPSFTAFPGGDIEASAILPAALPAWPCPHRLKTSDHSASTFDFYSRPFTPDQLKMAMEKTLNSINRWAEEVGVQSPSLLNFALSDGHTVIATRYSSVEGKPAASLYFASGTRWGESKTHPGEYIMSQSDRRQHVVIVASERLSADPEDWCEVSCDDSESECICIPIPRNSMIIISPEMNVTLHPLDAIVRPLAVASAKVVETSACDGSKVPCLGIPVYSQPPVSCQLGSCASELGPRQCEEPDAKKQRL